MIRCQSEGLDWEIFKRRISNGKQLHCSQGWTLQTSRYLFCTSYQWSLSTFKHIASQKSSTKQGPPTRPPVRCHVMTRAPSATSFTPFTSPLPGQGWVLCRVKTNPDSAGYCLPKLSKSQTRREGLFRWSSLCITTFLNRSNSRAPRPQHLHLTIGLQVYHMRYQCVCVSIESSSHDHRLQIWYLD